MLLTTLDHALLLASRAPSGFNNRHAGSGKRVLFVAEKRAALDVVYRRLREEGLEPFCLELHSNKTGKADVVAQFAKSLNFIAQPDAHDWERRAAELEKLRSALNGYTRALHFRHPCGLSA